MKKISLLLIGLSCSTISLFSQTSKNSFSLSFGPSIPLGNFGTTSLKNESTGNAKTGLSADLSFTHQLRNNFGLEVMLYGQSNELDRTKLEKQLSGKGFFGAPVPGSPRYYSNWKMNNKKWYAGALLIGISKKLPIGTYKSKLTFTPKVLLGAGSVMSPELYAISKTDTAYAIFERKKGTSIVPVFLLNASLNYQINKMVGIHLALDYVNSGKISFKNRTSKITASDGGLIGTVITGLENSRNPPISSEDSKDYKISLQSVNPKLGVTLSF